ncbi:MAG TPA: S8 family peptidase [Stenomitos sp.]
MTRQTRLSVALGFLALSLVGCGMPNSGTAIRSTTGTAMSNVYSVGGQPQLIVKRRMGIQALSSVKNVRRVRSTQISGVEVDAVTDGNLEAALQALKNDPSVVYAEPNYRLSIPTLQDEVKAEAITPNPESNFKGEYGPKLIQSLEANAKTDGKGQIIAVVDTGVDLTHPDLAPKLVPGVNTADTKATAADDQGHGTNCAGIAASLKDDQGGIVGVAPGAKIMPVKVLGADGSGSDASVAEGIKWAADHGATVISLSLGGPSPTQTGAEAVKYALSKGCVVVAAMGNNGSGQKSYPAAYPGVIAVAASDCNDKIASFSQYGTWCSVSAPGYSILSTFPTYNVSGIDEYAKNKDFMEKFGMRMQLKYAYVTGTSQATPHVAGLAALVRAANPSLTPDQVKAKIEGAAVHTSGMTADFDLHFGHGRINALKAL